MKFNMTAAGSGAVFFLGTRAHYQVLQQPTPLDVENGNTTGEQPALWRHADGWTYSELTDTTSTEELEKEPKTRAKNCSSETALCEKIGMKPAALNNSESDGRSKPRRRLPLIACLAALARRKPRPVDHWRRVESALACTYKESCRCLDCQSRYFECDESDECSSDDGDFVPRILAASLAQHAPPPEDEPDEVFQEYQEQAADSTSTDLLLEAPEPERMSVSSEEGADAELHLEVVAGTPVLLNYLLTHPLTCAIV